MTEKYLKIPMLLFHLKTKINHVERGLPERAVFVQRIEQEVPR